jgi:hypothetical protein
MARVGSIVSSKLAGLLTADSGLTTSIAMITADANITLPGIGPQQVVTQHVALELAEKTFPLKYPLVNVYCDKVSNTLREKFRVFSGKAHLVIETRVSQDRLDGVESQLQIYVDAVTQVLDQSRGDWGQGMFYSGGYEVTFDAVKQGGKNFVQLAKVTLEVEISSN